MTNKLKMALCQLKVKDTKQENIQKAEEMIKTAVENGANFLVLPEMFNCPYDNSKFAQYAEEEHSGETIQQISQVAKALGIYIVAGSIPEKSQGKIYNTSFTFNPHGQIIGKHRKVHLFDIDVKGKISFRESDVLAAGEKATVFDTEFCKIGVGICYDMRFPELLRIMALKGAKLIIIPGAFNMVTGPAHWEALAKIRALDNQVFIAAASPARDEAASYIAYGNSLVMDPWGNTLARADEKESIIYAEVDLSTVNRIREELPLLKHRRTDLYEVIERNK